MPYKLTLVLTPKQAADVKYYTEQAARRAGVAEQDVALVRVVGRSIDARQRQPKVNLTLEVYADCEPQPAPVHFDYPSVAGRTEVVIVGSGPAGLFTALRLIERGYRPVILEQGRDVSARKRDIAQINRNGAVDPDSNYAFGEGGAGTFSDGKLFTRSKKRGDYNKALQTLVFHGATPEILYESHPHIGTDKLPRVISNIRRTILEAGGSFVFDARVTDVELHDDRVKGVWVGDTLYEGAAVVLATGHSARDIYELLHRRACVWKPSLLRWACGSNIRRRLSTRYSTTASRGESICLRPPIRWSARRVGVASIRSVCAPGIHRSGDDRCGRIGGERYVAQRPELRFRQFRFGDRGAACGFRASAGRVGRAGRAEIPAAVRAAGPAIRRRASDRSGPACRRFRGGTCERFAAPTRIYRALCLPGWISGCPDLSPLPCGRVSPLSGGGCGDS